MATSSNGSDRDTGAVYAGFHLVWIISGWQFAGGGVEGAVVKIWLGVGVVMATLAFSEPGSAAETRAVHQTKVAATSGTAELRARRIFRDHPAYVRSYSPTYFARPYYYAPYPYGVPVPFFLGFGYLPYY
jgi:hypothetical protein